MNQAGYRIANTGVQKAMGVSEKVAIKCFPSHTTKHWNSTFLEIWERTENFFALCHCCSVKCWWLSLPPVDWSSMNFIWHSELVSSVNITTEWDPLINQVKQQRNGFQLEKNSPGKPHFCLNLAWQSWILCSLAMLYPSLHSQINFRQLRFRFSSTLKLK